jgi:hypothetical protein
MSVSVGLVGTNVAAAAIAARAAQAMVPAAAVPAVDAELERRRRVVQFGKPAP